MKYCKKCQIETPRFDRGECKPCAKKQKAAYREKNREKVNAAHRAWRAANLESAKAICAKWRANNVEKTRERKNARYAANKDKIKAYFAARYVGNKEKIKAINKNWRDNNPLAARTSLQNYRAKKRKNGGKLSKGLAEKLFKLQIGKCACCKQPLGDNYHLDHIIPVALEGVNTDDNIQLLCASCNCSKGAKHPVDFMQSRGFLL